MVAVSTAMNAMLKRRREEWIAANGPCANCGFWGELEVDHIDPAQKENHRIWCWSKERREAELKKCQVLCRFCHSIKSAREARERAEREAALPQVGPQVLAVLDRYERVSHAGGGS